MTNPYSAPNSFQAPNEARSSVAGPAMALIIVSSIWLVLITMGIAFNIFLLASGMVDQMVQPGGGITKEMQVTLRLVFAVCIGIANGVVLYGAIQMRKLENLSLARMSAIISVIPCCGPCYLIGIPFGIWALVVLGKPEVKSAFRS